MGITSAQQSWDNRGMELAQKKQLTGLAGVGAIVAGVILGMSEVRVTGGSCGSVFSPAGRSGSGVGDYLVAEWCSGSLAGRGALTWGLIIIGAIALVAAVLLRESSERPAQGAVAGEQAENEGAEPQPRTGFVGVGDEIDSIDLRKIRDN